jgi:hypothetical protein
MPTLEWLKYGALGLGLALAAYSFFLVRRALRVSQLDTRRLILLVAYMLFSLALAGAGFYSEYLSKHEKSFARTYAKALLAESDINMRKDVAHCQAFLGRAALFLQIVGDDNYAAVDQKSRVADTSCADGVNSIVPTLKEYAK